MNITHAKRSMLLAALLSGSVFAGSASAQDSNQELAAAVAQVKQIEADLAASRTRRDAIESDKFMDIHGSGWLYNKAESHALSQNLGASRGLKVIKAERTGPDFVAFSKDLVVESTMTTTYYEVPNPQDVARAAGTMTNDPAALARAAQNQRGPGPGETYAPNPYRTRLTKIWHRIDGRWQLVLSTATRVGLKVVPGMP